MAEQVVEGDANHHPRKRKLNMWPFAYKRFEKGVNKAIVQSQKDAKELSVDNLDSETPSPQGKKNKNSYSSPPYPTFETKVDWLTNAGKRSFSPIQKTNLNISPIKKIESRYPGTPHPFGTSNTGKQDNNRIHARTKAELPLSQDRCRTRRSHHQNTLSKIQENELSSFYCNNGEDDAHTLSGNSIINNYFLNGNEMNNSINEDNRFVNRSPSASSSPTNDASSNINLISSPCHNLIQKFTDETNQSSRWSSNSSNDVSCNDNDKNAMWNNSKHDLVDTYSDRRLRVIPKITNSLKVLKRRVYASSQVLEVPLNNIRLALYEEPGSMRFLGCTLKVLAYVLEKRSVNDLDGDIAYQILDILNEIDDVIIQKQQYIVWVMKMTLSAMSKYQDDNDILIKGVEIMKNIVIDTVIRSYSEGKDYYFISVCAAGGVEILLNSYRVLQGMPKIICDRLLTDMYKIAEDYEKWIFTDSVGQNEVQDEEDLMLIYCRFTVFRISNYDGDNYYPGTLKTVVSSSCDDSHLEIII